MMKNAYDYIVCHIHTYVHLLSFIIPFIYRQLLGVINLSCCCCFYSNINRWKSVYIVHIIKSKYVAYLVAGACLHFSFPNWVLSWMLHSPRVVANCSTNYITWPAAHKIILWGNIRRASMPIRVCSKRSISWVGTFPPSLSVSHSQFPCDI